MDRKAEKGDRLTRKWRVLGALWETTKEFGLMDESRAQPVLSPVGDGRRSIRDARRELAEDPSGRPRS
ncbi:MAG: hypothetical protein ACM3XS_05390 [Bacteroidota bacterium]